MSFLVEYKLNGLAFYEENCYVVTVNRTGRDCRCMGMSSQNSCTLLYQCCDFATVVICLLTDLVESGISSHQNCIPVLQMLLVVSL